MNRTTLSLVFSLLLWQLTRFGALILLLSSRWQAQILWFVMAGTTVDAVVLSWLLSRHGLPSTSRSLIPQLGVRDRGNVRLIGLIICFCATGFASSVPLINGTTTVMPEGPDHGERTLDQLASIEGGCVRVIGGQTHLSFLGAVEYSVTPRVTEFFYAVPYELADWTADQPVRAWAILSEQDLDSDSPHQNAVASIVNPGGLHAGAFRLAITNAEERFGLKSASRGVMLRLIETAPASAWSISNPTIWIGVIYGLGYLCAIPYAIRAAAEVDHGLAQESPGALPATAPAVTAGSMPRKRRSATLPPVSPAWLRTRRAWFAIHVAGFATLAVWLCNSSTVWPAFVIAFALPVMEFVAAMVAFRDTHVRASGRFGILAWLIPTSALFSMLLLGAAAIGFRSSRAADVATEITGSSHEPASVDFPNDDRVVTLPDSLRPRDDLAGSFWAPTDTARVRRMTPVVDADWCSESPVSIWIESSDRDDDRLAEEPLKLVRRSTHHDDVRRREALRDAETRCGVTAAPRIVVLERVETPERTSSEAGGFIVIGLLLNLAAWCLSACCWPKSKATATLS